MNGYAVFKVQTHSPKQRRGYLTNGVRQPRKYRGCLKMICKNHERQPSFLGVAVEKLVKNSENSALTLRGRLCLSKKCAVFAFGDAMQRSEQPGAFPTALFELYGATSEGYRPCSQDTIPP